MEKRGREESREERKEGKEWDGENYVMKQFFLTVEMKKFIW